MRFLSRIITVACTAMGEVISSGIKAAMNNYNGLIINDLIQEV